MFSSCHNMGKIHLFWPKKLNSLCSFPLRVLSWSSQRPPNGIWLPPDTPLTQLTSDVGSGSPETGPPPSVRGDELCNFSIMIVLKTYIFDTHFTTLWKVGSWPFHKHLTLGKNQKLRNLPLQVQRSSLWSPQFLCCSSAPLSYALRW